MFVYEIDVLVLPPEHEFHTRPQKIFHSIKRTVQKPLFLIRILSFDVTEA